MARDDAQYVMHSHTTAGMAVAAQEQGLLPLNQMSMQFFGRTSYQDYEGIALDLDERDRLVRPATCCRSSSGCPSSRMCS
jgi:ribulose-5-phosphate 4-epimerase/fuculose-1-phosphate aldolase